MPGRKTAERPPSRVSASASAPAPTSASAPAPAPSVSRETLDRLERYADLVQRWNRSINLVSHGDSSVIWTRHVLDSLRLLPLVPPAAAWGIDLGSGAGFPGLVLSLASGIPFHLVEADRRKAAFLVEAQRMTSAPVQIHCARIEDVPLPRAPLITARALAPLASLLAYADRLMLPGGTALFPKGARAEEEVAEAKKHWTMQVTRFDDPHRPSSTVLAITGLTHA